MAPIESIGRPKLARGSHRLSASQFRGGASLTNSPHRRGKAIRAISYLCALAAIPAFEARDRISGAILRPLLIVKLHQSISYTAQYQNK